MQAQVSIELIERDCVVCGRKFRVLKGSKQGYCGKECAVTLGPLGIPGAVKVKGVDGTRVLGERAQQSMLERRENARSIARSIAQRSSASTSAQDLSEGASSTPSGDVRTGPGSSSSSGRPTTGGESTGSQLSRRPGTEETHPASSGGLPDHLSLAASDILSLSRRSALRLSRIMRATITDDDLARVKSGDGRLDVTRTELAIQAANAITAIVQSNVNLLKSMRSGK